MFKYVYSLGAQQVLLERMASNVAIVKGDVLYWAAGYLSNAYGSVTTALIAGVASQSVDNSGGSAGDKTVVFDACPLSVYAADTADTMAIAQVGYNCALASANTITSASQGSDITGVVKIIGMISTSKAEVRLNFAGIADT